MSWFYRLSLVKKVVYLQVLGLVCLMALFITGLTVMRSQAKAVETIYQKQVVSLASMLDFVQVVKQLPASTNRIIVWVTAGYDQENIDRIVVQLNSEIEHSLKSIQKMKDASDSASREGVLLRRISDTLQVFCKGIQNTSKMALLDAQLASMSLAGTEKKFLGISADMDSLIQDYTSRAEMAYHNSVDTATKASIGFIVVSGLAAIFTIILLISILRLVVYPVKAIVETLDEMTSGQWNLTRRVPVKSSDEIGKLSLAINSFIERLQEIIKDLNHKIGILERTSDGFTRSSVRMADASSEAGSKTDSVSSIANQVSGVVHSVSASTNDISNSVKSVAIAVREVSLSIQDVAKSCTEELDIAKKADSAVKISREQVDQLGSAAKDIGRVVGIIQNIAAQTNLLALNATIEAATAGDAGKGFAVVASEVKQLARSTSDATSEIRKQVEGIQTGVQQAMESMASVSGVVGRITGISQNIAAAVEEQSVTVVEIAKEVESVSTGANSVAADITRSAHDLEKVSDDLRGVAQSVSSLKQDADSVKRETTDLGSVSKDLKHVAHQFHV